MGREAELRTIEHLLDEAGDGRAALLLSGTAGVGKTTVWSAGVERAHDRGFTILSCRPAATEIRLRQDVLAATGDE